MNYEGQLYGNAGGIYIPLTMTTHAVDKMEKDLDEIREIINPNFSDEQLVVEVKRMKLQEEADEMYEKADARLIAAAPEMLKELKDLVNSEVLISHCVDKERLVSLIAKAEGRAE